MRHAEFTALVQVDGLSATLSSPASERLPEPLRGRVGIAGRCQRIEGVSFSIAAGETLAIAGEDGSGKALLCAALLGHAPLSEGTAAIEGVDYPRLRGESARRFRRRCQAVFSDAFGQLAPESTIGEALRVPLDLWHRDEDRASRQRRMEEAMALCGVSELLRPLRPAQLDAVERQQVALARAVLAGPSWIILHDFVRGLDAVAAGELLSRARLVVERLACAALFFTDDLAEAWQMGDSIAVVHRGRLVERGPADQIVSRPSHPGARRLASVDW